MTARTDNAETWKEILPRTWVSCLSRPRVMLSDITTCVWKYITRLREDLDISPALYRWRYLTL